MIKIWLPLCGLLGLVACAPSVPDSAAGVGFGDYDTYQREELARKAQLQTPLVLSPETTGAPGATNGGAGQAISASELAAAGIDISPETRVYSGSRQIYGPSPNERITTEGPVVVAPVPPGTYGSTRSQTQTPPPVAPGGSAEALITPEQTVPAPISDEQNFAAVASRETIDSDAARIAENRAQYQQVTVAAPAERPASVGPDIVAFALSTQHPVGQKQFSRTFASEAKARRACARYAGPDLAQRAFLEQGGPQRDRLGLDPDGDGFACNWNPEPFRTAVRG